MGHALTRVGPHNCLSPLSVTTVSNSRLFNPISFSFSSPFENSLLADFDGPYIFQTLSTLLRLFDTLSPPCLLLRLASSLQARPTRSPSQCPTRIDPASPIGHVPALVTCPPTRHSHPGPAFTRPGSALHHCCPFAPGPHPHHELPSLLPCVGPSVVPAHTDPLASPPGPRPQPELICVFCFTTGSPVASVPSATHREPLVSVRCPGHPPAPARTFNAAATARGPDRPGLACSRRAHRWRLYLVPHTGNRSFRCAARGTPPAPARTFNAAATARGPDRPGLACTALCATGTRDSDIPARQAIRPS